MGNINQQPPHFFRKLFRGFCKPSLHPYLEGDLLEHFQEKAQTHGLKKARWRFAKDVIKLFRPGIIRSFIPSQKLNHADMFKHNLLITLRNVKRDFSSFIINLLGLVTALTTSLFIYLWITDEASVNDFHIKGDRLYQVFLNEPTPYGVETDPGTQVQLAGTLKDEFPEVDQSAAVIPYEWFDGEKFVLSDGGERFTSSRNQFATKDYFQLFSFNIIRGNQAALLNDKRSVVISAELADRLFKSYDAVGKTLEWLHEDYGGLYQVSGVFETLTSSSTQQFDAVFHFDIIKEDEGDSWLEWTESDPSTFVTLKPKANPELFNDKLSKLVKSKNNNLQSYLFAQPFPDTYLYDRFENGIPVGGRISYLKLFGLIAVFILLIASINFMIMSTARASKRMKEIGIKKAMGAERAHIAMQYLIESVSITMIALIISLALTWLFLPQFNQMAGKQISMDLDPELILYLILAAITTGVLAGSYPALYLSGFNPVRALKGQLSKSLNGQITRKTLVVFQFAISTILTVAVIVVSQQINLIQSKDLGFDKENLIWFTMGKTDSEKNGGVDGLSPERIESFLQLLNNTPGVQHSSNFAHNVLGAYGTTTGLSWDGKDPAVNALFAQIAGGYEFIETMGMEMKVGRSYSRDFSSDLDKIILNETAMAAIGYENPIGKSINLWGQDREIIGVVKDFHIDMLYQDIKPAFISLSSNDFASQVMVRMSAGDHKATIDRIKQVYEDYFIAGIPFEFQFLNEDYQRFYAREFRAGVFTQYATAIALFITCLGLVGFASFTLQRRLKEIAIRKVLGSTPWQVLALLFRSFLILVLTAMVIALPASFFISKSWLDTFAYRVDLEIWFFLVAGLSVMLITIATVGYQTLRVSRTNAVEHLSLDQ
ncbi:MAG: FtsX-like permease family protein [Roseivirga sp.]|nr:FtsX-like permease family protein [Roseivirga sp.]